MSMIEALFESERLIILIPRKAFSFMRRLIYFFYRITILNFILFIDYFISKRFYNEDTFHIFAGRSTKINPYICIFSHFDKNNLIDSYVVFYLQELAKNGCDIIFVTTSPSLSHDEQNKIAPFCKKMITRRNRGRDFGAFKCGINNIDHIGQYEKVILANDSVYGPLYDLKEVLHYGDKQHLDIWGASDSLRNGYHIQSYFVIFGKKTIKDPAFSEFWDHVCYLLHRQNIINRYEIGMSRYFLKRGYKLGALCDYATIQKNLFSNTHLQKTLDKKTARLLLKKRRLLNPTHFFWNVMIAEYRFPFIKRELLLHNPERLQIADWKDFVKKHSQFDMDIIQKHLSRLSTPGES